MEFHPEKVKQAGSIKRAVWKIWGNLSSEQDLIREQGRIELE